jgi:hypothetical protein
MGYLSIEPGRAGGARRVKLKPGRPVPSSLRVLASKTAKDKDVAMGYAENGRPEITETDAIVKPQGMGGYIPHVRSKHGEMGEYTKLHINDPYTLQDNDFDEDDY